MCTGKCSRCIAITLYPLVVISIICNIVLFFPDGNVTYDKDGHITEEVKYMGGLIGGGVLMFLSIAFAGVGVAGGLYSIIVAVLSLQNGPLCKTGLVWTTPFKELTDDSHYLMDKTLWSLCTEPKNIVEFNLGLFGTLLATSCLQVILCATQMINGLFGCLCGTCNKEAQIA
ncbi:transmembrane 4 L6 family member 4 isoform X2 [Maylandia zebra]|uniref:transmembrane 4 L6 family member 4 isoform X2 n=1 Tax=Maylandia zebra TaxID=106582 RepID=UPI00403C8DFC